MSHRKLTHAEFVAEARQLFGDDPKTYAFQCPNCKDVATVQDFIDAGDEHAASVGQECIGRLLGVLKGPAKAWKGRGCDWVAYGLFRGPWEVVMPVEGDKPERSAWSFAFAASKTGGDQS